MSRFGRHAGAGAVALALVLAGSLPAAAHCCHVPEGRFGNAGDGSGSIEERGRLEGGGRIFIYTGRHGIEGHPPHRVRETPFGFIDEVPPHFGPVGRLRAHLAWCESRYRSYRSSDNSFRTHRGELRACFSPYLP